MTTRAWPEASRRRHSAPNSSRTMLFLPARMACSRSRSARTNETASPGATPISATATTRSGRNPYREVFRLMWRRIVTYGFPTSPRAVLGQFASPDLLSSRLAAGPLSSNGHVLGRLQRSTYIQVRLALQAPSGVAVRAEGAARGEG